MIFYTRFIHDNKSLLLNLFQILHSSGKLNDEKFVELVQKYIATYKGYVADDAESIITKLEKVIEKECTVKDKEEVRINNLFNCINGPRKHIESILIRF